MPYAVATSGSLARRCRRTLIGVVLGSALITTTQATAQRPAQQAPVQQSRTAWCESLHYPAGPAAIAYRGRDTRCEGVTRDVWRATSFVPLSFTNGPRMIDLTRASASLSWQAPAEKRLRLATRARVDGGTYWLEARALTGSFSWPATVLVQSGARAGEVDFLAWYEEQIGGESHVVYVPLTTSVPLPASSAVPWCCRS
jgi:hypothetical protein